MKNYICFISLLLSMVSTVGYCVEPKTILHRDIKGSFPIVTNTVELIKGEISDATPAITSNVVDRTRPEIAGIAGSVFVQNADFALTNIANDTELRLFSGEMASAEFDGNGTVDVIIDVTNTALDRAVDAIMILNCASNGEMTVCTKTNNVVIPCVVKKRKGENPLQFSAGQLMYFFTKIGNENGTNKIFIVTQEIE